MSQQKEIGTLVVVVLKAQHLHQPSFYKQDPYVQASLSGLKKRTKVDPKGGQHPVWDDEFRFPIPADVGKDKVNRILEVSCYKEEQRGEDVLLGKGTVDIEETLKSGEFDDWVPLETAAGARGEVYLEMTFYANSPPPLTRRPSKLNSSDRLARPAAYFTQGQQSSPKLASVVSLPTVAERKQSPQSIQIPSSLIPAHGAKSQASRQASPTVGAALAVAATRDSLSPVDASSGKKPGLPTSLHPGGQTGPRPIPPHHRNRVMSTGGPHPETLPDQHQRKTLASHAASLPPFPRSQAEVQSLSYTPAIASVMGSRVPLAPPSVIVEEPIEDNPPVAFPVLFPVDYNSFAYDPSSYAQLNSQAYSPSQIQGYPETNTSYQRTMPIQSPHILPGQPQQLYDTGPRKTSPSPQYNQYSTSPISHIQAPTTQPRQQPTYPLQPQQHPPHQQSYLPPPQQYAPVPPQQQSYLGQRPPCTQTPHPQVSQAYQHQYPSSVTPQQQPPLYSQTSQQPKQSHLTAPPPPPSVQSQTPQPYASQLPHQTQSHFSPPPPPPPPPPPSLSTHNPDHSPVPQPQTPMAPSRPGQDLQPSIATLLSSQLVPNTAGDRVAQAKEAPLAITTASPVTEAVLQKEVRGGLEGASKKQAIEESGKVVEESAQLGRSKEQGREENEDTRQADEEDGRQHEEELKRQEEIQHQDMERRKQEQEEQRKREDEDRKKREEEWRQRIQEEHKKQEEEWRIRLEEQHKKQEEEWRIRMEEDLRKREEEHRMREEEERKRKEEEREEEERRKRQEEEQRRRQEKEREEERRRYEEERKRREEEEHRKQEAERIRREREVGRQRKAAEEARRRRAEEQEAERKWQEELARMKARAEQEAADAAFARAQMEAEEEERRKREEADMEVARREQAHEEELEKRRRAERMQRMEEADRELARRLDMELNLSNEPLSGGDQPRQRRVAESGRH